MGLGFDNRTPPADIWIHTDRFTLRRIDLATGRHETIERWPASPLERAHIREYRGRIFGVPHGHLRWADPEHLECEVAVTRPAAPSSETFVLSRRWDATHGRWVGKTRWETG